MPRNFDKPGDFDPSFWNQIPNTFDLKQKIYQEKNLLIKKIVELNNYSLKKITDQNFSEKDTDGIQNSYQLNDTKRITYLNIPMVTLDEKPKAVKGPDWDSIVEATIQTEVERARFCGCYQCRIDAQDAQQWYFS